MRIVKKFGIDTGIANLAISTVYNSAVYDLGPNWRQLSVIIQGLFTASTSATLRTIFENDPAETFNNATSPAGINLDSNTNNLTTTGNINYKVKAVERYFKIQFTNGSTAAQTATSFFIPYAVV